MYIFYLLRLSNETIGVILLTFLGKHFHGWILRVSTVETDEIILVAMGTDVKDEMFLLIDVI